MRKIAVASVETNRIPMTPLPRSSPLATACAGSGCLASRFYFRMHETNESIFHCVTYAIFSMRACRLPFSAGFTVQEPASGAFPGYGAENGGSKSAQLRHEDMQEFSVSSNGDRWFLIQGSAADEVHVLHRANPSSGGYETRTPVDVFLSMRPFSPEREALVALLEKQALSPDENGLPPLSRSSPT
ncbi:hypothetical protein [Rhizobium sp. TRM95796]|uniref:hypothetical protein n=1 Tax=Rhizobium sp. TRM95796 TaxID=2979862 RepID=UPI0021E8652E|nr:hypothetical protein [Rhizobium sp. TRM95796]MCV3768748.1 hypothetical protein [Rhizobium sp. TRM95796]